MINQVIQLVKPKTFEIVTKHVELLDTHVIVRPTHLSICHADQRYYKGTRSEEILQNKLPMALIHEAVGEVQYDPVGQFRYGDRVILVPNIPGSYFGREKTLSELNPKVGENYCLNGQFRSSGYDGFMQELISQPRELVVRVPSHIPSPLLAISEMISVCIHAIKRFSYYSHGNNESFGVWGDGNISYILSLLLRRKYPESKIYVFGKHADKLEMFSFVDQTYLLHENIENLKINHFFECVGGEAQSEVLNKIIYIIQPGGTISALGVSEQKVNLDVRMLMEKGLILVGDSRSGVDDFKDAIEYMLDDYILSYLNGLISSIIKVKSVKDIHKTFEADSLKHYGKTIMEWGI